MLTTRIPRRPLAAALLVAAQAAAAQPLGRPGLWETLARNPELDQARAAMQERMAAMTPAQRAQMQALMNSRGVGVTPSGAVRVCVTPEMARGEMPAAMPEGCKGSTQAKGRTLAFRYSCPGGNEGHGEFAYAEDGRSYTGWTDVVAQGRTTHIEHSGKWLAADCGNLEPPRRAR